jgi:hypothetical protein
VLIAETEVRMGNKRGRRGSYQRRGVAVHFPADQPEPGAVVEKVFWSTEPDEDFYWCLHCEQGKTTKELLDNHLMCTTPACDGAGFDFDFWSWKKERARHPDWPEVPVRGVLYPLYPNTDFPKK